MSIEDYSSEGQQASAWDTISPVIVSVGTLVMNGAFVIAGLAALYLLYALFSGNLADLASHAAADRTRLMGVVNFAGKALGGGLAIGALCALVVTWGEESTGYFLLGGAAAFGLGVPFIYNIAGGQGAGSGTASVHVNTALAHFIHAAYIPGAIGAGLVFVDVVKRLVSGVKPKTLANEDFTYGGEAAPERIPRRTSLLAKCWEGPYCREFIRAACPIFITRKACWREKKGCYCEESIVSSAASKVQGIQLDMVPSISIVAGGGVSAESVGVAASNMLDVGGGRSSAPLQTGPAPVRKVELSHRQKVERCKSCVIYNEHQREKYKLLMPVAVLGSIVLCVLFAQTLRHVIGLSFASIDAVLGKISFSGQGSNLKGVSETAEWILVGAVGLMIVSKVLQMVEWACFKAKI